MTINNFKSILKIINWKQDTVFPSIRFTDPTNNIFIVITQDIEIFVKQYVYSNTGNKYTSTLCICKNSEETIQYISQLDTNTLSPNGKNK